MTLENIRHLFKRRFHRCEDNLVLMGEDEEAAHYYCSVCGNTIGWLKVDMTRKVFMPTEGMTNGMLRKL
jgi:hypothetical protein